MSRLRIGHELNVNGGSQSCEVLQLLGEGGQGEVYRVRTQTDELALKWYFKPFVTSEQRKSLADLISKGAPNERFLWPLALTSTAEGTGLGYLMPLRTKEYAGIPALLKGKITPTFKALCRAGMQLSDAYFQLHSRGLCYRDISLGNAFLNPDAGDILICDNDNVAINKRGRASILGTPRFIAPEVIRGEAVPSRETDLFSLAVLLFYLFMLHHPFEGKRETEIHCLDGFAMDEIYGRNPVFIFDPNDRSNEPDPRFHKRVSTYWKLYPSFLRQLFVRAFTDGIHDPNARVRESEWRAKLANLQDSIIYCQRCGAENLYDSDRSSGTWCWYPQCGQQINPPLLLVIDNRVITLNHDREISRHNLDGTSYDFDTIVGKVAENPKSPGVWGLKNTSLSKWVVRLADGSMHDVDPGRSAGLKQGLTLYFGSVEGKVVSGNGTTAGAP